MRWFERKIRRYEHRRWTTDDNRRVQPFHWGLEHIGGSSNDPRPAAFVRDYARKAIESSTEWYAASPADNYRLDVGRFATDVEAVIVGGRGGVPFRARFDGLAGVVADESCGTGVIGGAADVL